MADMRIGIRIDANGASAERALSGVESRLHGLQRASSSAASALDREMAAATRRLRADMESAGRAADRMADAQRNSARAASLFGEAIGLAMAAVSGRALYATLAEFDRLNASLKTVTGSAATAAGVMDQLKQFARDTPYELSQVTEAFIRLRSLGLDASMSSLQSFGNTAAAMGKPLMQFIEAVADASTNEFERLKEFGIKAKQEGDQVTFTFQGVSTTVQKTAADIQTYLLQLGRTQFAAGMTDQMNTVAGAASNLQDAFSQLVDTLGNLGIRDALKRGFAGVTEFLDQLRRDIESVHGVGQEGIRANLQNQITMYRNIVERLSAGAPNLTIGIGDTAAALGRSKALEDAKTKLAELEKQFASLNGEMQRGAEAAKTATRAMGQQAPASQAAAAALRGLSDAQQAVARQVAEAARAAKVDPALALAIARTESRFNPSARSSAGALGTMQLMPGTARGLGVDPTDPAQNIQGGIKYIQQLQREFKSLTEIAAAYNAGPGNVRRYGGVPPFAETQDYVRKVLAAYKDISQQLGGDSGFNAAREQFDLLRESTSRWIGQLDDATRAAQRQADVTVSGLDVSRAALDRERDQYQRTQQEKIDAARGSFDATLRLEQERETRMKAFAATELELIRQQYDARQQALEAARAGLQAQVANPNLSAEEERRAKQSLADIGADLVKLANDRAEAEAKAGQAALSSNAGVAELQQKQRAFIVGINADLEFQRQLYLQLQAAKAAGASPDGLAIIRQTAEQTRDTSLVSQSDIANLERMIAQTKIYEQSIADLTQTQRDATTDVREQQLRENAYWDQTIGRAEQLATIWREIGSEQGGAMSRLTVSLAQYGKNVSQITAYWNEAGRQQEWGDMAGLKEGLAQAGAAAMTLAETMLAIRANTEAGTQAYANLTTAAENFAIVAQWINVLDGIASILKQLKEGDPYTAAIRAAASAAMVVSLGIQTGFAANQTNAQNKYSVPGQEGGVFGDPAKASESIIDALEIVRDNSTNDLSYSAAMLRALEGIEAAMLGVSNSIIRNVQPANVRTGRMSGLGDLDVGGIDPLGSLLGDLIFSTYRKITDFGIEAGQQALSDIITKGFSGRVYTDIETTTKVFGMTVSKSVETVFDGLDPTISKEFTKAFQSINRAIIEGGKAFGLTAGDFAKRLRGFVVDMGRISTKDMTGEELQKKISQMFSEQSDRIARKFMPRLGAFQQVGEGYFKTFIRVAEGINRAGGELERLGIKAINFRQIADKQADVAAEIVRQSLLAQDGLGQGVRRYIGELTGSAEEIIDAYKKLRDATRALRTAGLETNLTRAEVNAGGGLDAYGSSLQTYIEKFLTPGERLVGGWQTMADEFNALGLKMPQTNAEFRKMVEGIDITSEAGQKLRGRLISLAPAFDDLTSAMSEAMGALQAAYDQAKSNVKGIRDFLDSLKSSDAAPGNKMDRYQAARKTYLDTLAKANAGDQDAISALQGAAQTFLGLSKDIFGGTAQYSQDFQAVAAGMGGLADAIQQQISSAESTVPALKDNTNALTALKDALAAYTATLAQISGIQNGQTGQSVADKNNQNNSEAWQLERNQARAAWQATLDKQMAGLRQAIRNGNPNARDSWLRAIDATVAEIAASKWNLYTIHDPGKKRGWLDDTWLVGMYAQGGLAKPGMALVGEEGPELVRFDAPARVMTAQETRQALRGDSDEKTAAAIESLKREMIASVRVQSAAYPEMIAELRELRAKVAEMERQQRLRA